MWLTSSGHSSKVRATRRLSTAPFLEWLGTGPKQVLQKGWNAVPAPAVADWRPNGTTRRGRKATEKSCRALNTYVGVSADVVFGGTVSWPFKVDRQKGWERNLARSTEQIFPDKWSSATLAMK